MKIYESQLDKLIKHYLVREYKEQGIEGMTTKDFLPLCAALLFPYKDDKIESDSQACGTILPIVNSIKKFTRKTRGLEKYNFEGLRKYFQNKWLPNLDIRQQIQLIKGISLITEVEDNGFFSIKGNEIVHERYLNIQVLDISYNYGSEDFEIPTEVHLIDETAKIEDNGIKDEDIEREEDVISLAPLKEFLRSNFSLNQYPKGLYQYDYFWENKLTGEQYDDLKKILRDLHINKRLLKEEIEGYGTIARVVALYMSEWYKREYNGNDRNNALNDIGIRYDISRYIWEHLPKEYLYTHSDGKGVTEWLNSIYILGGLPIKYTQTNNRFKSITNALFSIRQADDSSEADIEEICESFDRNNKVIENALKSENGSWRQYIIKLVDYITNNDLSYLPFSESDASKPPFSEFVRSLREGYDIELPKHFFTPEYRVWTYDYSEYGDDSGYIESDFYVHIGLHKSENIITERELTKLGVSLPAGSTTFNIRLGIEDKEGRTICPEQCRTYFKIGNGCNDFCGVGGTDISTTIDLYTAKTISIWLESGEYKKEIHAFTVPQHIELYSTGHPYLWTTKTNNAARKVLFYNKVIYTPQDIDEQDILPKSDGINQWGWIHQNNPITLKDHEGKCTEISLGASENIIVDFRTNTLKKDVNLLPEGCVECVIDGEEAEPVPLLYYSKGKDLIMTCDGMKDRELTQNYIIEFKPLNETHFTEWTNQDKPNQGFIILRISCRDESKKKRGWRRMVYFIPDNYPIINRNLENNYITFKGNDIIPFNETLKSYFIEKKNKFKDSYDYEFKSTTIPFRIGDENNYIIVNVYRAFKWQQIWNQGLLIKNVIDASTAIIPVATILEKYYFLKIIDENGYHEYATQRNPQQNEYIKDYFDHPLDIALYNDTTEGRAIHTGATVLDISGAFQRYIYLSRFEDISRVEMKVREIKVEENINRRVEKILLSISDKHAYKYNFYYWSGNKDERPIELNKERLGERSYCLNIPYALDDKAVVFQSLRDYIPNLYFRPIYANENWKWHIYLNRYDDVKDNMDYMISCYHLAVEHKIYFSVFPSLRHLQDRDRFTEFIRTYIRKKNYNLLKEDFENLTRLAKELAMDWFFIDKNTLIRRDDNYKTTMRKNLRELLRYSPIARIDPYYSQKFIDIYFDRDLDNIRDGNLARHFLKAIGSVKYFNKNYNDYDNIENRVKFLNSLIKRENNIFLEIRNILNL